jgi:hypothetical protein
VEAEGRVIEAVIHVLNKTGIRVTNLLETIKMAEDNDESQLCLDPNRLNIHSAYRNSMDDDMEVIFILIVCCKHRLKLKSPYSEAQKKQENNYEMNGMRFMNISLTNGDI